MRRWSFFSVVSVVLLAFACSEESSSSSTPIPDAGAEPDATEKEDVKATPETSTPEASPDSCSPCPLSLSVTLNGVTRSFERVQFGYDDAAKTLLQLEAHAGGKPECPTASSPNPDRTMVIGGVRATGPSTEKDGVKVTLFDYKGDLSADLAVKATKASLTPANCCLTPGQVAFTFAATFPKGSATGTFVADHCDSLDL